MLYKDFHKLFSLLKTLCFELQPVGETRYWFEKKILKDDEGRAEKFKKVKKYIDEYHKFFIDDCLLKIDKSAVENLLEEYFELKNILVKGGDGKKSNKGDDSIRQIEEKLRKVISESFTKDSRYNALFSEKENNNKKTNAIISFFDKNKSKYDNIKSIEEDIKFFDKFKSYFSTYNENRKNIYSNEEKHTAIPYRLVNENLDIYYKNIFALNKIVEVLPDIRDKILQNFDIDVDKFKNIEGYVSCFTQNQIEDYNLIISGKSVENKSKIQGINEYVNLYNQKEKETKLPNLKKLYKQILTDKDTESFKIDKILNDEELIVILKDYYERLNKILCNQELEKVFESVESFDLNKIYINNDTSLTSISKSVYGDFNFISTIIIKDYDANFEGKINNKNYEKKREDSLKEIKEYSLAKIEELVFNYECNYRDKLVNHIKSEARKLIGEISKKYNEVKSILEKDIKSEEKSIIKNKNEVGKIKDFLDSIKDLQCFVKNIQPKNKNLEVDQNFYNSINYELLSEIVYIYNKVRNYLTQKPFSKEKINLTFKNPTLLNGWDLNKEKDNTCILLMKSGFYYLGIIDSKNKNVLKNYPNDKESNYKKMEYKLLPGPNRMLPKVFFSKKGREIYNPSDELLEKYKNEDYKAGNNFDLNFCHELIDFFKEAINKNEDWKNFNFNFSDTKSYKNISEFYKEISEQGYKINFKDISEKYVNSLVSEGNLYLFKIYNKDFSKYSKGNSNLHTLYWKALFDEANLKDVVYKLNGKAQMFFRKKSIKENETIIHKANESIKNKNLNNDKKQSIFKYDIVKNKHYTVDKFLFHVPITLNFKNKNEKNLNDKVKDSIKDYENIHIIGIDRGERHLLYLTIIDVKGDIVKQMSLNTISNSYKEKIIDMNYRSLLDEREKERDCARKSWMTIENIKELKNGYMSQVVHRIVELMLEYNAILVLEDLNSGFIKSRKKVEKQVYDKFEAKMLDKLSYIVSKDKAFEDEGGVLNAYQLANANIKGKQNGFVFYIPAWCTSKIDPITGFINLFDLKDISKEKSGKDFISNFDDIRYNEKDDLFEFKFEYSKFTKKSFGKRKDWTICSYGSRIRSFRNPRKSNSWDNEEITLTEEFKKLFNRYSIDLNNIKEDINNKADAKFFNAVPMNDSFYGFSILFKLVVQMRNSKSNSTDSMDDYILSPVKSKKGFFYDSRCCNKGLPENADANGAYNIARKGLMVVNRIKESFAEKNLCNILNNDWLEYVQEFDKE